jgi:hypothetical protein
MPLSGSIAQIWDGIVGRKSIGLKSCCVGLPSYCERCKLSQCDPQVFASITKEDAIRDCDPVYELGGAVRLVLLNRMGKDGFSGLKVNQITCNRRRLRDRSPQRQRYAKKK